MKFNLQIKLFFLILFKGKPSSIIVATMSRQTLINIVSNRWRDVSIDVIKKTLSLPGIRTKS